MSNIEAEILEIFVDESLESLDAWEKCCLSLVAGDGGAHATPVQNSENADAVAQLFRLAHNI